MVKLMQGKGTLIVIGWWIGLIVYVILVFASVAAWINTKIILEEIDKIKKQIGIPEETASNFLSLTDNPDDGDNIKQK
ncbi:hypothetical protein BSNK01_07580 [Bacillaceae bacterium]